VWWDRNIPPGAQYDQTIGGALDEAGAVLVLWSAASVESVWVKEEASRGNARGVLVPALIDDARPPLGFGRLQTAKLAEWKGDPNDPEFERLVASLRGKLKAKAEDLLVGALPKVVESPKADRQKRRESGVLRVPLELRGSEASYSLLETISSTSRNRVYLGVHLKQGLQVAVKCARGAASDRRALDRLENEARLGMRVDHPNVCQVTDYRPPRFSAIARVSPPLGALLGRIVPAPRRTRRERLTADEEELATIAAAHPPFLVMPFLKGELLTERMASVGRFSLAEGIPILVEVCDGLQHIHERGIVFRDVKPENVMLVGGGAQRAQIFDFDLAIDARSREAGGKIYKGKFTVGTAEFMSPEQVRNERLDPRSDIFQLGVVAHELFAARLPYAGESAEEQMLERVKTRPTPVREHAPDLPRRLETTILKALARNPDNRFRTAAELGRELSALLS
jgi:serine/threonine protein kinase